MVRVKSWHTGQVSMESVSCEPALDLGERENQEVQAGRQLTVGGRWLILKAGPQPGVLRGMESTHYRHLKHTGLLASAQVDIPEPGSKLVTKQSDAKHQIAWATGPSPPMQLKQAHGWGWALWKKSALCLLGSATCKSVKSSQHWLQQGIRPSGSVHTGGVERYALVRGPGTGCIAPHINVLWRGGGMQGAKGRAGCGDNQGLGGGAFSSNSFLPCQAVCSYKGLV